MCRRYSVLPVCGLPLQVVSNRISPFGPNRSPKVLAALAANSAMVALRFAQAVAVFLGHCRVPSDFASSSMTVLFPTSTFCAISSITASGVILR